MSDPRGTHGVVPVMTMNAYENALRQFEQAVEALGMSANQVAMIKDPRKVIEINLPVREERVLTELDRIMRLAFGDVLATALEHDVPMRVAAFIVAIVRVTRTAELRGLYA